MNLCDLLTFTWPNPVEILFGDIINNSGYNTTLATQKDIYNTAEKNNYWPDYKIYEIKAQDSIICVYLVPKKNMFNERVKTNE